MLHLLYLNSYCTSSLEMYCQTNVSFVISFSTIFQVEFLQLIKNWFTRLQVFKLLFLFYIHLKIGLQHKWGFCFYVICLDRKSVWIQELENFNWCWRLQLNLLCSQVINRNTEWTDISVFLACSHKRRRCDDRCTALLVWCLTQAVLGFVFPKRNTIFMFWMLLNAENVYMQTGRNNSSSNLNNLIPKNLYASFNPPWYFSA